MSHWAELPVMGAGPTVVTVKVARDQQFPADLGMKIVNGVRLAQGIVEATRTILDQDPYYDTLMDEDWKRFQWAAWKTLKCRAANPPRGDERVSPFTAEQMTKVKSKLSRISAGLHGAHGALVIKMGFPGLQGKFCHGYMKMCGLKLTGLVQPHFFQYFNRHQADSTSTFAKIPMVTGDIHLSRSWFDDEDITVNEVAQTILHEAGHKYAKLTDVWYQNEHDMGTDHHAAKDCLKNADSYANFCMVATREWEDKLEHGNRPLGYQSWGTAGNP